MAKEAQLPVIDLDGDQAQVARELVEAAIEHGFVYLRNTGKDIEIPAIANTFELVWTHKTFHFQCLAHELRYLQRIDPEALCFAVRGEECLQDAAR